MLTHRRLSDYTHLFLPLSPPTAPSLSPLVALLEDVYALEGALSTHAPPHAVALALPRRWADFAKEAREAMFSAKGRLRSAIPPCCAQPPPPSPPSVATAQALLSKFD